MYHNLPSDARFWSFLFSVDEDLAETTRKQACPCGGRLHCANYPRKPRGGPDQLPETYQLRFSFCCDRDGCRKRVDAAVGALPRPKGLPRCRGHPGQRHAARADATPGPRALRTLRRRPAHHRPLAGLLARTLPQTPFWKVARARSGPRCRSSRPFHSPSSTPSSAASDDCDGWGRLLRFLAPITIPGGLRIELS